MKNKMKRKEKEREEEKEKEENKKKKYKWRGEKRIENEMTKYDMTLCEHQSTWCWV